MSGSRAGTGKTAPEPAGSDDPRPLLGEPLALDLVNTRWIGPAGRQDLLCDTAGLTIWLAGAGLADTCSADEPTLAALRHTRDALLAAIAEGSVAALNEVLDHGRIRRCVVAGAPVDEIEVEPSWRPSWLAADSYTGLLVRGADRIRPCASSRCILYFYDTSKNGTRRWCSMSACGNRAKAARHYDRSRGGR